MNENDNLSECQSQERAIADWLLEGRHITPLDALKLCGCLRLSARIYDLKAKGMKVLSRKIHAAGGKMVAEYFLEQAVKNEGTEDL